MRKTASALLFALGLTFAPAPSYAQKTGTTAVEGPAPLSASPLDRDKCPLSHPIKGNKAGRQASRPADPIYHVPGSR